MKHLFKGLLLFLSLISLTACTTPIKEGHIVDKHMTEEHKETNTYIMGDGMPIYSEDKNGNGHTVTIQVNEETYNHQKIGNFWRISI